MKRLGIITPGGIGAGINGQGFPALMQIVTHLAKSYEVDVFSHAFVVNKIENVKFHYAPRWVYGSLLRWAYIKWSLIKNHFQKKFDVLFAFWGYPSGALTVMLGKLLNRPSIVYLLGGESANLPQIQYGLMRNSFTRKLVLSTCRGASIVMALSDFQLQHLRKNGVHREIKIIPFGVDRNLFVRSDKKNDGVLKIIHVANLTPVKDQVTLIRAFALVNSQIKSQLKIVGPDFMKGQMQKLVRELNVFDDVEFTGWMSYTRIPSLLAEADCFMLTSLSESHGSSTTEAMMCGLLPVSTRVGIMADLGDEFGIVCEVGDHESLARQLISIYKDPVLWKKKTEKAYAWAQEHDLNWTLARINEQIEIALRNES